VVAGCYLVPSWIRRSTGWSNLHEARGHAFDDTCTGSLRRIEATLLYVMRRLSTLRVEFADSI
jgi:hypothetical protein